MLLGQQNLNCSGRKKSFSLLKGEQHAKQKFKNQQKIISRKSGANWHLNIWLRRLLINKSKGVQIVQTMENTRIFNKFKKKYLQNLSFYHFFLEIFFCVLCQVFCYVILVSSFLLFEQKYLYSCFRAKLDEWRDFKFWFWGDLIGWLLSRESHERT